MEFNLNSGGFWTKIGVSSLYVIGFLLGIAVIAAFIIPCILVYACYALLFKTYRHRKGHGSWHGMGRM